LAQDNKDHVAKFKPVGGGNAVLTKDVAKIAKLVPTEAELVNLRAPFLASVA